MANEDSDLESDVEGGEIGEGEEGEEGKGGSKKLIIIIAAVVLIGGAVAAFFLLGGDGDSEEPEDGEEVEEIVEVKEAIYVEVPKAITANLPSGKRTRTVQIKMSFVVRSEEAKTNVTMHMPQLKNDVLMLVSQKNADDLKLPEGRLKLQQEALETVQKTMTALVKEPTVEKVLFVSFVIQ